MSEKEIINAFLSHFGKDAEALPKIRDLLKRKGYDIRDSSIDETEPNNAKNPEYIKTLLRPKIDWAGKVLVLIGPETHTRDWVNWEIEYAHEKGDKRIIGIFLPGASDSDVPENLIKYGDALVTWNSDKLEAAIDGDDSCWYDSNNNPRNPGNVDRSNC